jgi:site-specific DNA recombinase
MAALKPRPSFQVLIMSEESRLGRETIETAFLRKQLVQAGVRVFFYLTETERTLDSPMDKVMLSLAAFADELEREKARQRTTDSLMQKARAGHVTGGVVFGYDNLTIVADSGKKSHVERRINEPQARIIREIFDRYASGWGYARIAKALNTAHAPSPRPTEDRPAGWSPSSVRSILRRDLYRGVLLWNPPRNATNGDANIRRLGPKLSGFGFLSTKVCGSCPTCSGTLHRSGWYGRGRRLRQRRDRAQSCDETSDLATYSVDSAGAGRADGR